MVTNPKTLNRRHVAWTLAAALFISAFFIGKNQYRIAKERYASALALAEQSKKLAEQSKNLAEQSKKVADESQQIAAVARSAAEESLRISLENQKIAVKHSITTLSPAETYGKYGQLIRKANMYPIPCPAQDESVAVILSIGQSNSANQSEQLNHSGYGNRVINFFAGKCYKADSPLLGATGVGGEWNTLLGNKLIEANLFHTVVIISSGIGGSPISRWTKGGDLNGLMHKALDDAKPFYRPTFITWHQGESDYQAKTDPTVYRRRFLSMVETLPQVPIFIFVATNDGSPGWRAANGIAKMQRSLIGATPFIVAGADSDALVTKWDRSVADEVHFTGTGQEKVAAATASSIRKYYAKRVIPPLPIAASNSR